ncbi:MAG: MBL fold metallo-hydrolase [Parachlamydiales bacterium]|jgi:glyoxylase-like metal-dependent hydrolase (beta-lactamase superfamily II)
MLIEIFLLGPLGNNTIVIASEKTHEAAVIDPSFGSEEVVVPYLKKKHLQLKAILLTHSHWDHIAGAADLKKSLPAPIYIHPLDLGNLEEPGSDRLPLIFAIEAVKADHLVKDGELIRIGEIVLQVLHTPGHTPGSVCYFGEKEKILFSGDTLFQGTMGSLNLPTSQPEKMWPSLKKLSRLPQETKVFPGHGKATTIGRESWLDKAEEFYS